MPSLLEIDELLLPSPLSHALGTEDTLWGPPTAGPPLPLLHRSTTSPAPLPSGPVAHPGEADGLGQPHGLVRRAATVGAGPWALGAGLVQPGGSGGLGRQMGMYALAAPAFPFPSLALPATVPCFSSFHPDGAAPLFFCPTPESGTAPTNPATWPPLSAGADLLAAVQQAPQHGPQQGACSSAAAGVLAQ